MKQMRSRFRLLTLLLVCAFLAVTAICTGTALKAAGITLSSLLSVPAPSATGTVQPASSVSPGVSPDPGATPGPSDSNGVPGLFRDLFGEPDNSPDPEYNVFGL